MTVNGKTRSSKQIIAAIQPCRSKWTLHSYSCLLSLEYHMHHDGIIILIWWYHTCIMFGYIHTNVTVA